MAEPVSDATGIEWGVVELFGHIRLAGRISEVERYGGMMLQLDIPGDDGEFRATQLIGNGALFRVTPTEEATARRIALSIAPAPVRRWELPASPELDDEDDQADDDEQPF